MIDPVVCVARHVGCVARHVGCVARHVGCVARHVGCVARHVTCMTHCEFKGFLMYHLLFHFHYPPPPPPPPPPKKKVFIVHTDLTLHSVQSLSRSGQFSAVSKAVWKNGEHRYQVAIKSATVQTQVKEHTLMLQEAAIMGQFIHPNIVSIYGVVNERHSVSK